MSVPPSQSVSSVQAARISPLSAVRIIISPRVCDRLSAYLLVSAAVRHRRRGIVKVHVLSQSPRGPAPHRGEREQPPHGREGEQPPHGSFAAHEAAAGPRTAPRCRPPHRHGRLSRLQNDRPARRHDSRDRREERPPRGPCGYHATATPRKPAAPPPPARPLCTTSTALPCRAPHLQGGHARLRRLHELDLDALPAHVSTRMREILTRNVTRHSHGPYGILANRVAALASIRPPHPLTTRKVPTPSSTTLSTTLRAP